MGSRIKKWSYIIIVINKRFLIKVVQKTVQQNGNLGKHLMDLEDIKTLPAHIIINVLEA